MTRAPKGTLDARARVRQVPVMPLYLYAIEPARPEMPTAPSAEEAALVDAHFAYLKAAWESSVVELVGRTTTAPFLGLALVQARDDAEAEAFLRADPAVAAGVFRGRIQPWKQVFPA